MVHSGIISAGSLIVGRTYKDAKQNRVLEVFKREDGTFDLFVNRRLYVGRVSEERLPWELCVRFGYCQDEYEPIRRELIENGKKKLFLSS